MKEQLSSLGITALQILSPVVIALLGWLAKKLIDLIDARVKNETVKGMLERLDTTALTVVTEIEQTTVSKLDPNAPKDSLVKARDAALASLKTLWGQKGLDDLKHVLGLDDQSLQKILLTYIESKVHALKQQTPPAPVAEKPAPAPAPAPAPVASVA